MKRILAAVVISFLVAPAASSEEIRIDANDCIELDIVSEPGSRYACPEGENISLRVYNKCPYGDIRVIPARGGRISGGKGRLPHPLVAPNEEYDGSERDIYVYCVPGYYDFTVKWCSEWEGLDMGYIKRKEEARGVNYIFVSNCHN